MGDGTRIQFWHNLWCGDILLKDDYPVLFHIAVDRVLIQERRGEGAMVGERERTGLIIAFMGIRIFDLLSFRVIFY